MGRVFAGGAAVSLVAPVIFLLAITKDPAITKLLALPLAIVTAALLNLMFSVARRDRLYGFGQFGLVAMVSGVTCLLMVGAVVELIARYAPWLNIGASLENFMLVPFIVSAIIPALAYSLGSGAAFWATGIHANEKLMASRPKFVPSNPRMSPPQTRPAVGARPARFQERRVENF